ncbi:23S rRNA (uracil(1939)-C(5))-methyltransferase RlmD [Oceanicoccus sagamiensis]|uniref:TRAM domain-containing protein n=1 Tax=Oceanicoccus sagamiensis TaxID=716816 RepID=A0A1X9NJ50_9GAMM|nr:23S rRNA (uracil(1939)-C(5))-methyltransferase RlmD [Oceanicoccus sagamiensis]ARN75865.1 hypothetical protein BST96_18205 [Oceanicoccus sagamiensis]
MAKFRSSSKPLRTFKPKRRQVPAGKYTLAIESLAEDGRGVARVNGKTVFVAGALAGEQVEVNYQQSHKRFDEAVVVKVLDASAERVTPVCQYYSQCGGCNLQHLAATAQRDYKRKTLQSKFSGLQGDTRFDDSLLGQALHYRHRVRFAIKADRKHFLLGFRQANSHQVVDIAECHVVKPSINALLPRIKPVLAGLKQRSSLLELSITEAANQQLAVVVLAKQALCAEDQAVLAEFADQQDLLFELYQSGDKAKQLLFRQGSAMLFYTLQSQLNMQFAATDFTQVNPQINQQLIDAAIDWLALNQQDSVADYFCGIGNFTLPIARRVKAVTGYELVADMVAKARGNAALNQLANADFQVADLMASGGKRSQAYNKVLLDPPRAGAEALCQQLLHSSAEKILYISCNPKTLYRDADILVAGGYQLARIALADMFPQTSHCEVLALFSLADPDH